MFWKLRGYFVFDRVMKTNLMRYLSSVYFVNQPLHVSGIFVAHHQEVYCIYTTIDNKYQLLYMYIYIYIYTDQPRVLVVRVSVY